MALHRWRRTPAPGARREFRSRYGVSRMRPLVSGVARPSPSSAGRPRFSSRRNKCPSACREKVHPAFSVLWPSVSSYSNQVVELPPPTPLLLERSLANRENETNVSLFGSSAEVRTSSEASSVGLRLSGARPTPAMHARQASSRHQTQSDAATAATGSTSSSARPRAVRDAEQNGSVACGGYVGLSTQRCRVISRPTGHSPQMTGVGTIRREAGWCL